MLYPSLNICCTGFVASRWSFRGCFVPKSRSVMRDIAQRLKVVPVSRRRTINNRERSLRSHSWPIDCRHVIQPVIHDDKITWQLTVTGKHVAPNCTLKLFSRCRFSPVKLTFFQFSIGLPMALLLKKKDRFREKTDGRRTVLAFNVNDHEIDRRVTDHG